MKTEIHVVGAAIIQYGKIFCAQRSSTMSLPLKWEFPGGKIEKGESPQDALTREILEEMSCQVIVGDQVAHTVHEYDFGVVHLTTFICVIIEGEPILKEHKSMKWLLAEELASLDWAPADIPTVEKLQEMNSRG
ncbi:(deoxy)nucleoside triphosphate pyrophosphohydrolase [Bacillus fonticola]|uniref:(deoxy)nucleoside triphosphate pyrophosphohydrolase n=1 Tax=Bacillus fonticola TaxID=2728853 RepID=UPI0014758F8F|nr:(deoxy)nucleoside triphosphate pyrophosphohydrolase [Bacillus fonticola]